jgi:hypothetical protein
LTWAKNPVSIYLDGGKVSNEAATNPLPARVEPHSSPPVTDAAIQRAGKVHTMGKCKYATDGSARPRTVRRHNAEQCICYGVHDGRPTQTSTHPATTGGESETHDADGTSHYTRFSDEPWGYDQYREFIRSTGQDPDKVTFTWGWTSNPGGGCWNKLNNVKPIKEADTEADVDLPALYAAARHASTHKHIRYTSQRATVIVYTDPQIGKVARRGGTAETIERSMLIREKLDTLLAQRGPSQVVILDGGDGFENFNSGGNPMFTNDLSLSGQMDMYGTELFEFINVGHKYAPVTVAGVPSNHTAWRAGKQLLGNPQDDLGLFMHHQVAKVTKAARMAVEWVQPADFDETVAVEVLGTTLGLVHGNQFGPSQAVQWWEKQTFGAQAIARADVLIHGHYHSFSANVAGRNPVNQRQRWSFGAPTLDNGSDWFRTVAGRDSDPGLLVFDVTEDGFDLSSMTILTA